MGLGTTIKDGLAWYEWLKKYLKVCVEERLSMEEDKTEPIHVIMNGPSLKDSIRYVRKFPGKVLMVNSAIIKLDNFDGIKPDYYCLVDPAYNNPGQECKELVEKTKNSLEQYERTMELFIPSYWRENFILKNPNIKTRFVISIPVPHGKNMCNMLKTNKASPIFQGVVVMGLYVALQLGYKCIYLHGAEEGYMKYYVVNEKNEVCMKNEHIYGNEETNLTRERGLHMLDEYRGNVYLYETLYLLKRYSDLCKAEIVNMSRSSMIDCFNRYDYGAIEE